MPEECKSVSRRRFSLASFFGMNRRDREPQLPSKPTTRSSDLGSVEISNPIHAKSGTERLADPRLPGKYHAKPGAFADFTDRFYPPAMLLHDAIGKRQAEPGALADRLGGEERLEDASQVFL